MRTSYLRPFSRPRRRYQDSEPWGIEVSGKRTASGSESVVCSGDSVWRRRPSMLRRTWARGAGLGARKTVFSTLAVTMHTYGRAQSRPARRRIFGGQGQREGPGTRFCHASRGRPWPIAENTAVGGRRPATADSRREYGGEEGEDYGCLGGRSVVVADELWRGRGGDWASKGD